MQARTPTTEHRQLNQFGIGNTCKIEAKRFEVSLYTHWTVQFSWVRVPLSLFSWHVWESESHAYRMEGHSHWYCPRRNPNAAVQLCDFILSPVSPNSLSNILAAFLQGFARHKSITRKRSTGNEHLISTLFVCKLLWAKLTSSRVNALIFSINLQTIFVMLISLLYTLFSSQNSVCLIWKYTNLIQVH